MSPSETRVSVPTHSPCVSCTAEGHYTLKRSLTHVVRTVAGGMTLVARSRGLTHYCPRCDGRLHVVGCEELTA